MSADREPACIEVIGHSNLSGWEEPTTADLERLDPCSYCYPEGDVVEDRSQLTIATLDPEHVHRRETTGPIDYEAVHGEEWSPRDTRDTLLAMDPEDAGLSPIEGGDA